jgi:O-acetyl-ADP-ribose deacetylase (regulator of RNase III)
VEERVIKLVAGSFFDYDADIRINTVNCVGVMGIGIALLFKRRYPEMYREYRAACQKGEVRPGRPHIWVGNDMFDKATIINFPTKVHWKKPSEYEYIEKGLKWLREYLFDKQGSTVTLPALGCGNGGLDWGRVKKTICNYLGGLNNDILLFKPHGIGKRG